MADASTQNEMRRWVAEMIGAFFLTFAGISAIVGTGGGNLVAIAFAHGGALALAVYTLGGISGAHVNPAISASLFIQRKLGQRDFVMYVIFQVIGATIAAFIAANVYPRSWVASVVDGATLGVMTASPASSLYNPGGALLLEVIMTFMLAMAVSAVVRAGDQFATASGLLIGGTLFVCILFGGPWTGASLNPARSMGPALAYNESVIWGTIWLYWIGPIIGGVLAGLMTKWLRGEKVTLAKETPPPPAA